MAAVTAVGLLHRSLLAFGIVSRRGRKRGEDDGHGGESLEEEARVMEEAGAVDGDSMAGDAEGDNAEHGGGHKHRLAEHAVEPDGGGPSAAPGSEGRERGERVGRAVPEREQRGPGDGRRQAEQAHAHRRGCGGRARAGGSKRERQRDEREEKKIG